jgi:hypothetical protein
MNQVHSKLRHILIIANKGIHYEITILKIIRSDFF